MTYNKRLKQTRLKRFIIFIILAVFAFIVSSPFITGFIIEKDFNAFTDKLNSYGANNFKVTGKFYRGIYSSTAQTEIAFTNSYVVVQLAHYIEHGPVIFNFKGWFSPSSYIPSDYKLALIKTKFIGKLQEQIDVVYAGQNAYEIDSSIDFDGNITSKLISNPVKIYDDGSTTNWQGLTANITSDLQFSTLNIDAKIPSIQYAEKTNNNQILTFKDIDIIYKHTADLEKDNFELTIDNMKITNNDVEEFSLHKYKFMLHAAQEQGMLDVDVQKRFDIFSIKDDVYGPFDFSFDIKNWNMNAINEISPVVQPMIPAPNDKALLALLIHKITMQSALNFSTPDGEIVTNINGSIGSPDITSITVDQVLPTLNYNQHLQISRKIIYKLLLKYGEDQILAKEKKFYEMNRTSTQTNPYSMSDEARTTLVKEWINKLVAKLISQKFIVLNNKDVTVDIIFQNSALQINGTEKSQADLMMLTKEFDIPTSTKQVAPAPKASVEPVQQNTTPTSPNSIEPTTEQTQ